MDDEIMQSHAEPNFQQLLYTWSSRMHYVLEEAQQAYQQST